MNQAAADINIEGELVLTDISEEQLKKLAVEIDNLLPKKEQYSSRFHLFLLQQAIRASLAHPRRTPRKPNYRR